MRSVSESKGFPACPAPFNMAEYVLRAAERHPAKVALQVLGPADQETWRYGELRNAVLGTATGLLQAGLRPGDIVLLRLGNTVDFPLAYLAALAVGLVPCPTSAALTDVEVTHIAETLRPAAILRDPQVASAAHIREISLDALRDMRGLPPADWAMGDPDRLGYVIFTSGTSGKPRAVAHAHRAIWARQMMFRDWYGLGPDDRLLHAGAFNWTYTMGTGLMDPWTMGATALIPEPGTKPQDLPALLDRSRATIFAAAPGVYRQMLRHRMKSRPATLRHGLSAGEKLPDATRTTWEAATGTPVFEAFGMTECSTFISARPGAEDSRQGRPQTGRRVAILGPDGPVPTGDEGTIAIHHSDPGLMLGYLGAPEETAARYQGAWFLTGDQGVMDADGHVRLLGRADDMMNAGGYRVSPIEVEEALAGAPGITGVAAAEVEVRPDVFVIAAFYTANAVLDETALAAYAETRLARYKQPRLYIHTPDLPTGGNGKLLRRTLADRFRSLTP